MTFLVSNRELKSALSTISMAVSGKEAAFLFRPVPGTDGRVEVLADKHGVCASASFSTTQPDGSSSGEGRQSFTINAKRLLMLISALSADSMMLFEHDPIEQETTVSVPGRTAVQFFSSDKKTLAAFPVWDERLKEARVTAQLSSDRLRSAIAWSKEFTGDPLGKSDAWSAMEFRDGTLTSSNKMTVCRVSMAGASNMRMRIHEKNGGAVMNFLRKAGGELVSVLETDTRAFLMRGNGSCLGIKRPDAVFPRFPEMEAPDQFLVKLETEELTNALGVIQSGAARHDNRLWISTDADGLLVLQMKTVGGQEATWPVDVRVTNLIDAPPLPAQMEMSADDLERLLGVVKTDRLQLRVSSYKSGGFFRYAATKFADEPRGDQGDRYEILVAWTRPTAQLGAPDSSSSRPIALPVAMLPEASSSKHDPDTGPAGVTAAVALVPRSEATQTPVHSYGEAP